MIVDRTTGSDEGEKSRKEVEGGSVRIDHVWFWQRNLRRVLIREMNQSLQSMVYWP